MKGYGEVMSEFRESAGCIVLAVIGLGVATMAAAAGLLWVAVRIARTAWGSP